MSEAETIESLRAEMAALKAEHEAALHVPGVWRCPYCNFELTKSILHAKSGGISPNLAQVEPCPNDGHKMVRVTWKESSESNYKFAVKLLDERVTLAKFLREAFPDLVNVEMEPIMRAISKLRTLKKEYQRLRVGFQNILISSKWSGTPATAYTKIAREMLDIEHSTAPLGKISGQCSHCHKPIGVCQCNRATLEHLRDSSAAHLKEMLATIPAMGSPEPKTITLIGAGGRQDVVNQSEYDALVKSGMMWEFYPDAPHQWPFL